ncbi:MAG TPA: gamma carbonic anhydrase family protein, partial [Acidimicrobiales bacterium]
VLHEVVVHTGATVGAGAVVRNGTDVPTNAMALGVPAKLRLESCTEDVAVASAALYAQNGRRYKAELKKL